MTTRSVIAAAAMVGAVASPNAASEIVAYQAIRICLFEGEERCVGVHAYPCMRALARQAAQGMKKCLDDERLAWDRVLNEDWADHMAHARRLDATNGDLAPASVAESLREAQSAWIAFRDADCGIFAAQRGIDAMRVVDEAACLLGLTAERVRELRSLMTYGR